MDTQGAPPPEGRLIEDARLAMRGMSQNGAAKLAGLSGTRWRQIVTGIASGGKGIRIPVHGNAETVARMAQVVGLTPEQLKSVGRTDAAEELRRLPAAPESERELSTQEQLREITAELRELRAEVKALRERDRSQADAGQLHRDIDAG